MDWARHILIGLLSALAVSVLVAWTGKGPADRQGWRSIKPGGMYMFGIGLGTLLTLGMAYVWLFVGSSRPDGEQQMRILYWLTLAFGAGTLVTLFQFVQARRTAIRWRGDVIVWRGQGGVEQTAKLTSAVALRTRFMGPTHIVFDTGAAVRVDPYATNAAVLLDLIEDRLQPPQA